MTTPRFPSWVVPIGLALLGLFAFSLVGGRETATARLAVVERRQDDTDSRLDRIDQKLDQILEHVRGW